MEALVELLLLLLILGGPLVFGYLLCCVYPPEVLRIMAGTALPPAPPGEDLRHALRLALRAPASAGDVDLVSALFELRREAEVHRPCLRSIAALLSDLLPGFSEPDLRRALELVRDQLQALARGVRQGVSL
jgi:hypothetical protein